MGPRKKNMLFLKKNRPKICRFKKSAYLCTRNRETNNEQNKNNKFTESKRGRLAQLVQSICLTSRGSAVRIRQRPQPLTNGSLAQLNRASDYGSEGYRFESCGSHKRAGSYQSGQMGQTVNLLAYAFGGSNPSLPTPLCGNSSVGRARPCQGRGREFEPRFPLHFHWCVSSVG